MDTKISFCSKILLFGEYSVIKNSQALSIPYSLFEGNLAFRRDNTVAIDPELKAFSLYLKQLSEANNLLFQFDLSSFEFDISQGLYFDSSIPQGYGVGSSGALVAAIFSRYHQENSENLDIKMLKSIFAQMESHFHGSSSGVDPLISYLNSPILIKNKHELGPVYIPQFKKGKGGIFLINTKRPRKTEPLVNLFLEKCSNKSFDRLCENELQYEHFSPMIPTLYRPIWNEGLKSHHYFFKLCGAGGGGFLMGITQDFAKVKQCLPAQEIRLLMNF
jgi:mevalonate kinase